METSHACPGQANSAWSFPQVVSADIFRYFPPTDAEFTGIALPFSRPYQRWAEKSRWVLLCYPVFSCVPPSACFSALLLALYSFYKLRQRYSWFVSVWSLIRCDVNPWAGLQGIARKQAQHRDFHSKSSVLRKFSKCSDHFKICYCFPWWPQLEFSAHT